MEKLWLLNKLLVPQYMLNINPEKATAELDEFYVSSGCWCWMLCIHWVNRLVDTFYTCEFLAQVMGHNQIIGKEKNLRGKFYIWFSILSIKFLHLLNIIVWRFSWDVFYFSMLLTACLCKNLVCCCVSNSNLARASSFLISLFWRKK